MKKETRRESWTVSTSTERTAPLLRSIAVEIMERTLALLELESHLSTCAREPEQVARCRAQLATHRRELRQVENELRRLGWVRDPRRPLCFVREQGGQTWLLSSEAA